MEWEFEGEKDFAVPTDSVGFVYLIENLDNGMIYVGKKNLYTHKYSVKTVVTKSGPNKGKKRKIKTKIIIDSNWRKYYGSSDWLNEDVKLLGEEKFRRTILRFCFSKAELSYYEAKEQFDRDVLLKDNNYNLWIGCKIRKGHLKGNEAYEDDDGE